MAQHVHPRVLQWLRSNYPRPQLDTDWLTECTNWLIHDKNISPDSNFQAFVDTVEEQLLSSDLRDSMSHGTGLPTHIARLDTNTILTGPPVLVEIAAMTEIAHSAFSLEQIRVARDERMRVDGAAETDDADEGDIDVDEGPPPKYPRGMLRFELTDGLTSIPAIEYRPLPSIILGVTSLGCKVQLKNVKIRSGIAWLEPDTIVLKGFSNKEREMNQKLDFARGLRARMGLPLLPEPAQMNASPPLALRSPLRDISPPPQLDPRHNDDEILENRKRRIPSSSVTLSDSHTSTQFENRPIASSSRVASASARAETATISPYFPSASQHGVMNSQTTRPLSTQRSIIDMTLEDTGEPVPSQLRFHPSTRSDHEMQIDWEQKISTTIDGPLGGMSLRNNARHADSKGKGKAEMIQDDDDEFGEDDFYIDQALLESLDRADMEARRISNEPMPNPPPSTAGSTSIPYSNGAHSRNVIEIADDDDCDDKENIPVATRHVRRRTDTDRAQGSQPVTSRDVIDLSDSD